jgi:putative transposase
MPSTFVSLNYHIVFSTKDRIPQIAASWETRLHEYLGGTIKGLGGVSLQVSGIEDHVHLLFGLKPTHCLSDLMRELKRTSSIWVHTEIGEKRFAWQEGYAAFTVSPSTCPSVRADIQNQREHHRRATFREELVDLLQRSGIEYDERYLD